MSWYTRDDEMALLRGLLLAPTDEELTSFAERKPRRHEEVEDFVYGVFGGEAAYTKALQQRKLKARIGQNLIPRAKIATKLRVAENFPLMPPVA